MEPITNSQYISTEGTNETLTIITLDRRINIYRKKIQISYQSTIHGSSSIQQKKKEIGYLFVLELKVMKFQ